MTKFPNRRFGVEIEYVGVHKQKIVDALNSIGVKCVAESYNHATRKHWKIVPDGSISCNRGYEFTGELVSPPLRGRNGLNKLQAVVEAIVATGAKVNRSCGLHVHVEAKDLSPNQVLAVSQRYFWLKSDINYFMHANRANSEWAQSVDPDRTLSRIQYIMKLYKYSVTNKSHFKLALNHGSRYTDININSYSRHETVEFRQHEGTLNSEKIQNWVQYCLYFVEGIKNEVPATKKLQLADIKNHDVYHGIPESVSSYYKTIVRKKKNRKKSCLS